MLGSPVYGAPRDVVEQVATLIENNYFDFAKARAIANDLRSAEKAGEFDRSVDPRDLATMLTLRLHPLDHHFRVTWSRNAVGSVLRRAFADIPEVSSETMDRRTAYGFRRVEMLPGAIGYIDLSSFADLGLGIANDPARDAADAKKRFGAMANPKCD